MNWDDAKRRKAASEAAVADAEAHSAERLRKQRELLDILLDNLHAFALKYQQTASEHGLNLSSPVRRGKAEFAEYKTISIGKIKLDPRRGRSSRYSQEYEVGPRVYVLGLPPRNPWHGTADSDSMFFLLNDRGEVWFEEWEFDGDDDNPGTRLASKFQVDQSSFDRLLNHIRFSGNANLEF